MTTARARVFRSKTWTSFAPLRPGVFALETSMHENEISKVIVDAAIEVHRELGGPGLLEDVYEEALAAELELRV